MLLRRIPMLIGVFVCLLANLTAQDTAIIKQDTIISSQWKRLIPSAAIPKEAPSQKSNNNLDLIKYKDRYYVGYRTAPTHFASTKTMTYIISSKDFKTWEFEHKFWVGADMREPRFVILNDELFFYFFEGGKKMLKFEPKYIWASKTTGDKDWTEKKSIKLDGYVPWRLREQNGIIYLSAYYGVNLYKNKHSADLRLFTSTDGFTFKKLSKEPQCTTKGAEEGEFIFDKEGNLWATVRLEGSGAYVVYADKDSLHKWELTYTKYKYDSALLFEHQDDIYLVSRRNLHKRNNGWATKFDNPVPKKAQRRGNLLRYSFSRKCTALFRLDKKKKELVHIMDFPSGGDTAFPGIAQIDENSYHLLNYSSRIYKKNQKKGLKLKKKRLNWITGQLRKTYIYHSIITFK